MAGTGAGADLSVAGPDLAFSPVTDSWLLVWQVQVASNDHDVYARRFDANWNPLGAAQGVEVTIIDWSVPKIAHLAAADEWRIVAYSRVGSGYQVNLRRWSATGAVGAPVVLGSFSGAAVPTFGPAIGGDPYQGTAPAFVCVAWPAGDTVRYRTVDRTGVLGTVQAIYGSDRIDDVAISKGNGTNNWLLAWVDYAALPTVTVSHRAARIRYDGTLVAGASGTTITLNSVSNLGPFIAGTLATSSPDHAGDFTVVFHVPLIPTLLLRKVRSTGGLIGAPALETLVPGFGVAPVGVETDGVRTLVTKGQGNNVRGVLLASVASASTWRVDGLPRADVAVADSAASLDAAIRPGAAAAGALVRPRGTVLLLGTPGGTSPSPLLEAIAARGLRLSSSRCGDFRAALDLLAGMATPGRLGALLVSHRFAATDLPAAFARARAADCIKAVVEHRDAIA